MLENKQLTADYYLVLITVRLQLANKLDRIFENTGNSGMTSFIAKCTRDNPLLHMFEMDEIKQQVFMKIVPREQLHALLGAIDEAFPEKEKGQNLIVISEISMVTGINDLAEPKDVDFVGAQTGFDEAYPYQLLTGIFNHGEGDDFIDATNDQGVIQHILVRGHGAAKLSSNYFGKFPQTEKDIVMQIISKEKAHNIFEYATTEGDIQNKNQIMFATDIIGLSQF